MKKTVYIMISTLILLVSTTSSWADTAMAKQVLAQNTTNPVCSSGYNGANPFDKSEQYKNNQFESGCSGQNYVDCLRKSWKNVK